MNTKKILIYAAVLTVMLAFGAESAERATLVTQPAYSSMSFYVYKPANVPNDFFSTYDGFLVYKDEKGIWKYASNENSGILKTEYVVGSVIPSVVRLKPLDAKISSVAPIIEPTTATIRPVGKKVAPDEVISLELNQPEVLEIDVTPITTRPAPTPKAKPKVQPKPKPAAQTRPERPKVLPQTTLVTPEYSLQIPTSDWTQNSSFMAIGKWQKSVDRIGVLDKPATPVAWKGDYPEVIYAWTGLQWRQMSARGPHVSALSTIKREIYGFTVHTNKLNALSWNDDDTYVLSQYAMMWGYRWLGQVLLGRNY
ncbi:MAG: hypothetical protein IJU31_02440 [Synergistaceae bacterium]|nr:hypothetical protein [Synergistaceae bacterium]